jgi:hypothetical protein
MEVFLKAWFWVMCVWAWFERLIPHLSARCAFGVDGEVAGKGLVSQALGFQMSAVQARRPYGRALGFV